MPVTLLQLCPHPGKKKKSVKKAEKKLKGWWESCVQVQYTVLERCGGTHLGSKAIFVPRGSKRCLGLPGKGFYSWVFFPHCFTRPDIYLYMDFLTFLADLDDLGWLHIRLYSVRLKLAEKWQLLSRKARLRRKWLFAYNFQRWQESTLLSGLKSFSNPSLLAS